MTSTKPYTRFCGIDVAKRKHVAQIIDRDGQCVARSQSFNNDAGGYQSILARLKDAGGPRKVLVGMEATGHYWYSLRDFLVNHRYEVAVLNPIQTAQQAKKGIRKRKTDKIDAGHIATLIKNGEHRPALVPGELAMTCRQLTRLRYAMTRRVPASSNGFGPDCIPSGRSTNPSLPPRSVLPGGSCSPRHPRPTRFWRWIGRN